MIEHTIDDNIAKLLARVSHAIQKSPDSASSVRVLAVSKTRPAEAIRLACESGLTEFGENYLSEALEKMAQLEDIALTWHFIGPIQANKTRPIAEHFDWVHSIDRPRVARRLSDQRPVGKGPLQGCIQVNVSAEASKSGVSIAELPALAEEVLTLPGIKLRGLMAVPAATTNVQSQREAFATLHRALESLRPLAPDLDTLSMGMSGDMEAAIAEGSTLVRIGTDIFGPRKM